MGSKVVGMGEGERRESERPTQPHLELQLALNDVEKELPKLLRVLLDAVLEAEGVNQAARHDGAVARKEGLLRRSPLLQKHFAHTGVC